MKPPSEKPGTAVSNSSGEFAYDNFEFPRRSYLQNQGEKKKSFTTKRKTGPEDTAGEDGKDVLLVNKELEKAKHSIAINLDEEFDDSDSEIIKRDIANDISKAKIRKNSNISMSDSRGSINDRDSSSGDSNSKAKDKIGAKKDKNSKEKDINGKSKDGDSKSGYKDRDANSEDKDDRENKNNNGESRSDEDKNGDGKEVNYDELNRNDHKRNKKGNKKNNKTVSSNLRKNNKDAKDENEYGVNENNNKGNNELDENKIEGFDIEGDKTKNTKDSGGSKKLKKDNQSSEGIPGKKQKNNEKDSENIDIGNDRNENRKNKLSEAEKNRINKDYSESDGSNNLEKKSYSKIKSGSPKLNKDNSQYNNSNDDLNKNKKQQHGLNNSDNDSIAGEYEKNKNIPKDGVIGDINSNLKDNNLMNNNNNVYNMRDGLNTSEFDDDSPDNSGRKGDKNISQNDQRSINENDGINGLESWNNSFDKENTVNEDNEDNKGNTSGRLSDRANSIINRKAKPIFISTNRKMFGDEIITDNFTTEYQYYRPTQKLLKSPIKTQKNFQEPTVLAEPEEKEAVKKSTNVMFKKHSNRSEKVMSNTDVLNEQNSIEIGKSIDENDGGIFESKSLFNLGEGNDFSIYKIETVKYSNESESSDFEKDKLLNILNAHLHSKPTNSLSAPNSISLPSISITKSENTTLPKLRINKGFKKPKFLNYQCRSGNLIPSIPFPVQSSIFYTLPFNIETLRGKVFQSITEKNELSYVRQTQYIIDPYNLHKINEKSIENHYMGPDGKLYENDKLFKLFPHLETKKTQYYVIKVLKSVFN